AFVLYVRSDILLKKRGELRHEAKSRDFATKSFVSVENFPAKKSLERSRLGKLRRFENNNKTEIYDLCE
ncbi:Hypothetical predicted protein, partial [Paramuricea clavata]